MNSLALVSGKGGSGKTIIALEMARALSEAGARVLLVDCDLATHGATYFLERQLGAAGANIASVDVALLKHIVGVPLKTQEGFWFVPSTIAPSTSPGPPATPVWTASDLLDALAANGHFDAVILDCQAGFSWLTAAAVRWAQRSLFVLEPDAVSASALRVLYLQLSEQLAGKQVFQVFNKLTEEERPAYERVISGGLFSSLPPIAFDWQVRAAFGIGEIPHPTAVWSAFGLSVLRCVRIVMPDLAGRIADLEDRTVGDWYTTIQDKLHELDALRREYRRSSEAAGSRLALARSSLFAGAIAALGLAIALFGVIRTQDSAAFDMTRLDSLFLFVGMSVSGMAAVWLISERRRSRLEGARLNSVEGLADVEREINKYRTLVATDPRLSEMELRHAIRAAKEAPEPEHLVRGRTCIQLGETLQRLAARIEGFGAAETEDLLETARRLVRELESAGPRSTRSGREQGMAARVGQLAENIGGELTWIESALAQRRGRNEGVRRELHTWPEVFKREIEILRSYARQCQETGIRLLAPAGPQPEPR